MALTAVRYAMTPTQQNTAPAASLTAWVKAGLAAWFFLQAPASNLPGVFIREASGAFSWVHRLIQQLRQTLTANTMRAVLRVMDAPLDCAPAQCGDPLKEVTI